MFGSLCSPLLLGWVIESAILNQAIVLMVIESLAILNQVKNTSSNPCGSVWGSVFGSL